MIKHYSIVKHCELVGGHKRPLDLDSCDEYRVAAIAKRTAHYLSLLSEIENPEHELIGVYGFYENITNGAITDLEYFEYVKIGDEIFMLIEDSGYDYP
jgi:hypothetical protein